ncbi:putative ribonuclease H-like domain-containing protein [Tanacetum coccineum]
MGGYSSLDIFLNSRGVIPSKTIADAKIAIQEMAAYSQKWHNGTSRTRSTETSDGLAAIQTQLNNLGREIKKVNEKVYAAQVGIKSNSSRISIQRNNANPFRYQERRQSMQDTLSKFMGESAKRHEENSNLIKEIRASTDAAIRNQGASIKTLEIQIRQISKERRDHMDHNSRKLTLNLSHINNSIPKRERPREFHFTCVYYNVCFDNALVDLGDRTVKYPKGIAENVLVGIGKFTFPIDFIILDMPENIKVPLILGIPFLSTARAKIDLRKNQGNDLMPTIEEGEVIEEFRTRDEDLDTRIDDCPILEDMDAYRDEGMGDVIVGELFLREVGIKARRFEGMITIYDGNNEVTYQMVRSHPRFKRHTNKQCNKIPPLLKVSEEDEMNGISIIAVTHVKFMKWYDYGCMDEIVVYEGRRTKLYKFKEGDFQRLNLRDIEYMLLLLVQKKIANLKKDFIFDFNVALRMSDISKRTPYTTYNNPQGIIYVDKFKRNRLMRSDELYKFSDGTLTSVRYVLHDIASNLRMDYLPKRIWSNLEKQRSRVMIKAIDKLQLERRLMRNLEKFVGRRDYREDFRLLERTI